MPEFGQLTAERLPSPAANGSAPAAPWQLSRATAQLVTFEVDVEAALAHLPNSVARPAPPYGRIFVVDYPESPVGPYREAQLLVSCRYRLLPRQLVAASVVTSDAARAATAANWGYTSETGQVDLKRSGAGFESTITTADGVTIRITSAEPDANSPAVIRYDPTIVARGGDQVSLATISAEPAAVHEAWIAVATTVEYSEGPRTSPWLRLRSRNPITCTIAVADFVLPEPTTI